MATILWPNLFPIPEMMTVAVFSTILLATPDKESVVRARIEPKIHAYARAAGVQFPPRQIMLRVFKDEKKMEVWGGNSPTSPLKRLVTYSVLAAAGGPGPKRQNGDRQVPEGWYFVDRFNPGSSYHLSMGINYPNSADRILATASDPGSDIFIHGNHLSDGCLAMGDSAIEEIYTLARMAKGKVIVFILPTKTPDPTDRQNGPLWGQLSAINTAFERNHTLPRVTSDARGQYKVK